MNIEIQSPNFEVNERIEQFVREKLNKLHHQLDRAIAAEVVLRRGDASDTRDKFAEIKLIVPGKDLFAKARAESFENAVVKATEELKKQIDRYKGKIAPWA